MDGNSTFTISVFFMIVGGLGGIYGIIAKRDSKKVQEGKAQGILEKTLDTMDQTLKSISAANEQFQKDHREEHVQLDKRMKLVEDYVLIQKHKSRKIKSDIEE